MDFKINGRKISNYSYAEVANGKSDDQLEVQEFYVVEPLHKEPSRLYPLKVVLHSAGYNAALTMMRGLQKKSEHEAVLNDGYTVFIDDFKMRERDYWWGWHFIESHSQDFKTTLHPVELRVLDSVAWLKKNCPVDVNKISLHGVSMGGSGALGIGLNRGDLFASVSAVVPAGISHALYRLKYPVAGDSTPAPVFIYLSNLDSHEQHPEEFFQPMNSRQLYFSFIWGNQGHDLSLSKLDVQKVVEFQSSIVKNKAYPAFFNVTQNSVYPGFNATAKGSQFGYVNSQFRWSIVEDSKNSFKAKIWIEKLSKKYKPAMKQVADIEFKRFQLFTLQAAECKIIKDNTIIKNVKVNNQSDCLRAVEISTTPLEIQLSNLRS